MNEIMNEITVRDANDTEQEIVRIEQNSRGNGVLVVIKASQDSVPRSDSEPDVKKALKFSLKQLIIRKRKLSGSIAYLLNEFYEDTGVQVLSLEKITAGAQVDSNDTIVKQGVTAVEINLEHLL